MLAGLPLGPLFPTSSLSLSLSLSLSHSHSPLSFSDMHSKALFSRLMKICPVEEPAKPTFSRVRMLPRRLSLSRAHLQIWGLGSRKGSVGLQSLDSLSVPPRYARRWACYVATENWIVDLYWPIKYSSVRCTTWVLCSSYPDGVWYDLGAPFASWS